MIKIRILKSENQIIELEVSGHSTYAEYGQNIVCASISVLTISIINGLIEICNIKKLKVIEDNGYIKLNISSNLNKKEKYLVNLFLETLLLSYKQIQEEYPNEIELKIKEI